MAVVICFSLRCVKRRCNKERRREMKGFLSELLFKFSLVQRRLVPSQLVIPVSSEILRLQPGEEIRVTDDPQAGLYKKLSGTVEQGPRINSVMVMVRLRHRWSKDGVVCSLPAFCLERVQDIATTAIGSEEQESHREHKRKHRKKHTAIEVAEEEEEEEEEEEITAIEDSELQQVATELRAVREAMSTLVRDRGRTLEQQQEVRRLAVRIGKLQQKEAVLSAAEDEVEKAEQEAYKARPQILPSLAIQKMDTHALCRMCDQKGISRATVEGRHDLLVLLGAADETAKGSERHRERKMDEESRARRKKRREDMLASYKKQTRPLVFTTS